MSDLLKASDVAKMLNVTTETILCWCRSGKIQAFRVGRKWHIPSEQFEVKEAKAND